MHPSRVKLLALAALAVGVVVLLNHTVARSVRESSQLDLGAAVINPHDFSYMLNPGRAICGDDGGAGVTLLALVPISAAGFTNRFIIRNTWASKTVFPRQFKVVFLLGNTNNATLNSLIRDESAMFGDIVQEDFADTYRNFTLKTLMGLKWAAAYCPGAKFLLKIDDDVCLNSYKLLNFLHERTAAGPPRDQMICRPHYNSNVIRDPRDKFFVPVQDYPAKKWHTYCDGAAYLLTTDLAAKFFARSLHVANFVFEDIHMGSLAKDVGAQIVDIRGRYDMVTFVVEEGGAFRAGVADVQDLFFVSVFDRFDIVTLWRHMVESAAAHMFKGFG